ncbi:LacI family DNA-binding transcriptional regulator [Edwardsiella anguillarum]|nr:LacI family DNA-binding transcriptional regulator [Edwardsiella anguillarum]
MRYKVRNIRLQDVADKAGVSLMTASRVISNPKLVAEKTRKQENTSKS